VQRRRFLALAVPAAFVLSGCARRSDELAGTADVPDRPAPEPEPDPSATPGRSPTPEPAPDAPTEPSGAGEEAAPTDGEPTVAEPEPDPALSDVEPTEWGERVTGVRTRLDTTAAVVALTFDACGGGGGSGYDAALIEHLRDEAVPATLFVNARWLREHPDVVVDLAADPLFELANHGTEHRPLSVDGRGVYGIRGTRSVDEVVEEVLSCQRLLTELTGDTPRFFRSGTAYYDEVAVEVVRQLGLEVAGFDVLGDAGATFSAGQVEQALLGSSAGSVALLHMNHPGSGTAAGVAAAIPTLRDRGFSFARLSEHGMV
jgi:peptidoglycan/xylan/chitin deacetylase (PgdA/CDA1 family)